MRIVVLDFRSDFTSRQFLHQQRSFLQGINRNIRVDTTFETERRIRAQTVTTRRLAHPSRMEISAFQEHVRSGFRRTGIQSAKYAGNTHRLFRVANHQVLVRQLAFHFVQCHERSSFGTSLHHNLATLNLVGIEAVHRLTVGMQNVVGNIDDVINRTHPNQTELVLQPFRTFLHGDALDGYSCITRASLRIFHHDIDVHVVVVHLECIDRRTLQCSLMSVLDKPCIQVAGYPIV